MFDIAEILNYIEFNRTTKIIQSITAPKKNALEEKEYKKVSKHYHQKNLLIG